MPTDHDKQLAAYLRIYFATWDVLEGTKVRIKKRLNEDLPQADRDELELKLLWVDTEQKKLQMRRRALERGEMPITKPPTDAQIAAVKQLLSQVEALTATAAAIKSALGFARNAVSEFNKVQGKA